MSGVSNGGGVSGTPSVFLSDPDVTLYHGDVLATLRELPTESVDCVVTSPPYWGLRDYGQEGQLGLEPTPERYVERMVEVFREVRRVLAPHGTCWVNLGDSYASKPAGSNGYDDGRTNREERTSGGVPPGLKPKDLVGIPWRVAFALQADGWYLRSDIIWAKPNPMPESVTDRPTKAHEYVFLLSKQPRYFFDQEAVREKYQDSREGGDGFRWHSERYTQQKGPQNNSAPTPRGPDGRRKTTVQGADGSIQHRDGERWPNGGRNIRSVWEIATQPYPEAHFATFPEELARRCIAAGTSEKGNCPECGAPWVREIQAERVAPAAPSGNREVSSVGWRPNCVAGCLLRKYRGLEAHYPDLAPRPAVVLDPFMGSGTVAYVARKLGRHSIGMDLNAEYLALAARRLQQQSLFAEVV